jgi:hypothetical protein
LRVANNERGCHGVCALTRFPGQGNNHFSQKLGFTEFSGFPCGGPMSAGLDSGPLSWRRLMTWVKYNAESVDHSLSWGGTYGVFWTLSICGIAASVMCTGASLVYVSYALVPCASAFMLALVLAPTVDKLGRRPPRLCGRVVCLDRCSRQRGDRRGQCIEDARLFLLPRAVNVVVVLVVVAALVNAIRQLVWDEVKLFVENDQARLDSGFAAALLSVRQLLTGEAAEGFPVGALDVSLVSFLFTEARQLYGATCELEPVAASHMRPIPPGACTGTKVGQACSAFSCSSGFYGGSIICETLGGFSGKYAP